MKIKVKELKKHLINAEIYSDHADIELVESIKEKGLLVPPLVTFDCRIISGHRRVDAVRTLYGQEYEIEVIEFDSRDEMDIVEALVHSNKQRIKTAEQIGREARELAKVINERVIVYRKEYGSTSSGSARTLPSSLTDALPKRETRQKVASELGVGRHYATRAAKLVTVIDDLMESGKIREAEQLRIKMNSDSVHKAYGIAIEQGYIRAKPKTEPPSLNCVTLTDWDLLDTDRKKSVISQAGKKEAKFNRQEDNSIEWALWSWNPISGCDTGCVYCYARDIANRFYPHKFTPTFYPDRLYAPRRTSLPSEAANNMGYKNVFTVSMGDMFGPWVPEEWIAAIMTEIENAPQWNFLILTKWPESLLNRTFPKNVWLGTTVDSQTKVAEAEKVFSQVKTTVKFISCEPLQEQIIFNSLEMFDWIIIGGRSRSTRTAEYRPPREWINQLETQARRDNCRIYEKQNLLERIKEYPE